MAFHPEQLPITVYEIYKCGPVAWILTVQSAVQVKITNIDTLTNIAFYLHHPELSGRRLRKDETKLIAEWKAYRTKIKPLIPHWIRIDSSPESTNSGKKTFEIISFELGAGT